MAAALEWWLRWVSAPVGGGADMTKAIAVTMALLLAATAIQPLSAAAERSLPYWASIAAGQARMRTGPGRNFPASWLYQRRDLPVKVIETYPSWRKVEDPDGTRGWMMVNLLSEQRTAIIRDGTQPLRVAPDPGARIAWRAMAGVVGRISHCSGGWCRFDVQGRTGYVDTAHVWGLNPGETVE